MFYTILMSVAVTVSNPLDEMRENVPIVIDVPAEAENAKSIIVENHPEIRWQLDDLNQDGISDELVIMLPVLQPKGKETLKITFSDKETVNPAPRCTAAMMKLNDKNKKHPALDCIAFPGDANNKDTYNSIYGHGAMLEGLCSAIRVYVDNRQSVDLYLKQTPRMELDSTFFYTTAAQLDEGGCGRDVLWAGSSVALGSFRGFTHEGQPATIDSVKTRQQRIVVSGPVRSIIEVVDRNWITPGGEVVDMRQRYTTYADSRDYDVVIKLTKANDEELYCTGIQKLAENPEGFSETYQDGVLSGSWGTNLPDKGMPDRYETLGLGIYTPSQYVSGSKEDELNYLTILKPDENGIIRYKFTATGLIDKTTPASNFAEWQQWLKDWARLQANPVEVVR